MAAIWRWSALGQRMAVARLDASHLFVLSFFTRKDGASLFSLLCCVCCRFFLCLEARSTRRISSQLSAIFAYNTPFGHLHSSCMVWNVTVLLIPSRPIPGAREYSLSEE